MANWSDLPILGNLGGNKPPITPQQGPAVPVPNAPPAGFSNNPKLLAIQLENATKTYNLASSPVEKAIASVNLKKAQLEYDRLKNSQPSVTEAQGTWGTRVAQQLSGEKDYEEAVREGYEPTSFRNRAADLLESAIGTKVNMIRDPASVRGRVGENKFLEGYMRAQSGANVGEMKEVPRMQTEIFPSPWQGVDEELRKNLYYGRMDQINAGLRAAGKPQITIQPYEQAFGKQLTKPMPSEEDIQHTMQVKKMSRDADLKALGY